MVEHALGRLAPSDWQHVEKYPLTALPTAERPEGVPSPVGINWYAEFDRPTKGKDGRWRVAADGRLTRIRGGHCVCFKPPALLDPAAWRIFYNQGQEGACCGFGVSRCMSLLNRKRYDAPRLYHTAQLGDEFPQTPPEEGTSVRATLDVARGEGLAPVRGKRSADTNATEGIAANRWATTIHEWTVAIGWPYAEEVPFLNSWGKSYPHLVWMPTGVAERLMREDGEFPIITDR